MNSRGRRKTNNKNEYKQKKVIRCKEKMLPVFEEDNCNDFIQKDKSDPKNNCKNCKHSF